MSPDTYPLLNYALYCAITLAVTILVGRSLHRNGRPFLEECFQGHEGMADSVNHLLLVGFYLVNFGLLALLLKTETPPHNLTELIECLSFKTGSALLGLGAMHLFNLWNFDHLRTRALRKKAWQAAFKPEPNAAPSTGPTPNNPAR